MSECACQERDSIVAAFPWKRLPPDMWSPRSRLSLLREAALAYARWPLAILALSQAGYVRTGWMTWEHGTPEWLAIHKARAARL